jgi:hypothetical protein
MCGQGRYISAATPPRAISAQKNSEFDRPRARPWNRDRARTKVLEAQRGDEPRPARTYGPPEPVRYDDPGKDRHADRDHLLSVPVPGRGVLPDDQKTKHDQPHRDDSAEPAILDAHTGGDQGRCDAISGLRTYGTPAQGASKTKVSAVLRRAGPLGLRAAFRESYRPLGCVALNPLDERIRSLQPGPSPGVIEVSQRRPAITA